MRKQIFNDLLLFQIFKNYEHFRLRKIETMFETLKRFRTLVSLILT